MSDLEIVMMNSPEAATYRTGVAGWVARDGQFYGEDESRARYAGGTHRACNNCGAVVEKRQMFCEACRGCKTIERYNALPRQPWTEGTMMATYDSDRFFSNWDEVEDFCEERDCTIASLLLVHCEECYATPLDVEHWIDDLPGEEREAPDWLIAAVDEFNTKIASQPNLSWCPTDIAVELPAAGEDTQ